MTVLSTINAIACALIAIRLMLYRRAGTRHRPWAGWLAYGLVLVAAYVPIEWLLSEPAPVSFTSVVFNLVLCVSVFATHGNVCDLFRPQQSWCATWGRR